MRLLTSSGSSQGVFAVPPQRREGGVVMICGAEGPVADGMGRGLCAETFPIL